MALEFDPTVNRYQSVTNPVQTSKTNASSPAKTAEKTAESGAVESGSKIKQEPDSVDLSTDAKSINKMSAEDRAALVKSLKADQEQQMNRFINMMTQTFQKQGFTAKTAENDDFWKMFSSGNLTVDWETKQNAIEAISEDGYWGVKQTSERIFQMAQALAGDDPEKMKEMQDAVAKGYAAAGKAWGGDLPDIAGQTIDAVNKMFEDYYAGQKTEEVTAAEG